MKANKGFGPKGKKNSPIFNVKNMPSDVMAYNTYLNGYTLKEVLKFCLFVLSEENRDHLFDELIFESRDTYDYLYENLILYNLVDRAVSEHELNYKELVRAVCDEFERYYDSKIEKYSEELIW